MPLPWKDPVRMYRQVSLIGFSVFQRAVLFRRRDDTVELPTIARFTFDIAIFAFDIARLAFAREETT
eukprot:9175524-Pyramimonas_sp.AAC.4